MSAALSMSEDRKANRLLGEKSPYLLQHAYNPVHWYPWGKEALALARRLQKPIFLSIGYSACHWCHVMEHECFEDVETASLMNANFVNIKVDREERPEIDHIYMTAVQIMTGGGGWPMSVWLTPDLKPFYAGAYFPREDQNGHLGFKTILRKLADAWVKDQKKICATAEEVTEAVRISSQTSEALSPLPPDARPLMDACAAQLFRAHDPEFGGFGGAPKFPMPVNLFFLLHYYDRTRQPQALQIVENTLQHIIRGGITDQIGGGFSRYSTDRQWMVPHFEKMLYDNAQLIWLCAGLFEWTENSVFENAARKAIAFVLSEMTHPEGGFFSAEDADSEGKEGKYYLWTLKEIQEILTPEEARVFIPHFGVTEQGNFIDPHTHQSGGNVLVRARTHLETAEAAGLTDLMAENLLESASDKLLRHRAQRFRPLLDDKVLTGWNGLMISALAHSARAFGDRSLIAKAEQAARFVRKNLYDRKKRELTHCWREGERKIPGNQSDYALFTQGLIDLYEETRNAAWLKWAEELQDKNNQLFYDAPHGGYFMSVPSDELLVRMKEDMDGVIPSGNSIAVSNGLRLLKTLHREDFLESIQKTLQTYLPAMESYPTALPLMIKALDLTLTR